MDNGIKKQQQLEQEALLYLLNAENQQRTADEIAHHLLLSPEEAQEMLNKLEDRQLITSKARPNGDDVYQLTQAGIQKTESR